MMNVKELGDKLEEIWGDWEEVFDVMMENNLHFKDDCIYTSDGSVVWEGITEGLYLDEMIKLIQDYFDLYRDYINSKFPSIPPSLNSLPERKSRFMDLC